MAGFPFWSSATDGTRPASFSESGTCTTSCPPARGAMLGGAWFAAQAETNRARPPASAESRRNLDWSRVPGTAALILATREGSPAPAPLELLAGEQRHQAHPVLGPCGRDPGQLGHGGRDVHRADEMGHVCPRGARGVTDVEHDALALVVRARLRLPPVLAEGEAIVRQVEDHRVVERALGLELLDDGLHRVVHREQRRSEEHTSE